jgi:hypothetical protein
MQLNGLQPDPPMLCIKVLSHIIPLIIKLPVQDYLLCLMLDN